MATGGNLLFDEVAHDDGLDYLLERILHLRFHGVALRQLQLARRGEGHQVCSTGAVVAPFGYSYSKLIEKCTRAYPTMEYAPHSFVTLPAAGAVLQRSFHSL